MPLDGGSEFQLIKIDKQTHMIKNEKKTHSHFGKGNELVLNSSSSFTSSTQTLRRDKIEEPDSDKMKMKTGSSCSWLLTLRTFFVFIFASMNIFSCSDSVGNRPSI